MAAQRELLNGGLVTARHGTLLRPGELQRADDCIYRPNDPAIHRVPGRVTYGSPTGGAAPVKGVKWLGFDSREDHIVCSVGTSLYFSPFTAITGGTFSTLYTGLTNNGDETLDAIQSNDVYYLLNGKDRPIRVYYGPLFVYDALTSGISTTMTSASNGFSRIVAGMKVSGLNIVAGTTVQSWTNAGTIVLSAVTQGTVSGGVIFEPADPAFPLLTARPSGMDPITSFGPVEVISGTWPSVDELGAGIYWFLITEAVNPNQADELESAFIGTPLSANVTDTAKSVRITKYSTQNTFATATLNRINAGADNLPYATHWIVYMSPKQKQASTIPSIASFRRVAVVPITTLSTTLADTNPSDGPRSPATVTISGTGNNWNNTAGLTAGSVGTAGNAVDGNAGYITAPTGRVAVFSNYNINTGALTGTITGVKVDITATFTNLERDRGHGGFAVQLRRVGGSAITSLTRIGYLSKASTIEVVSLGGEKDTWAIPWAAADFANSVFEVVLYFPGIANDQRNSIDAVRVTVYAGGTALNFNGKQYPVVTIQPQVGAPLSFPANGKMPAGHTGDVHDGVAIINDPSTANAIMYSLPYRFESWPVPYRMPLDSVKNDAVQIIRRVGSRLGVLMRSSVKRVNYLPRESDAEFDQGRAWEDIAVNDGCISRQAGVVVDLPNGSPILAYIGASGPKLTDLITIRPLNNDLDWGNLIDPTYLTNTVLRNYPNLYLLAMYYTPVGQSTNTKAIYFFYHQAFIKEDGTFPALGPINVKAKCADIALLNGSYVLMTGHTTDGNVYVEDQGTTSSDSSVSITPEILTRQFYPGGMGTETRVEKVYWHTDAAGNSTTGAITFEAFRQNIAEALTSLGTLTGDSVIGGLQHVLSDHTAESFCFKLSKAAAATAALSVNYVAVLPTVASPEKN